MLETAGAGGVPEAGRRQAQRRQAPALELQRSPSPSDPVTPPEQTGAQPGTAGV